MLKEVQRVLKEPSILACGVPASSCIDDMKV